MNTVLSMYIVYGFGAKLKQGIKWLIIESFISDHLNNKSGYFPSFFI